MDYRVLYRKYRPKDFNSLIGQEYIVETLKKAIISNKCAHAYIFSGPRGVGKTSTAKIFAKALSCENNTDGNPCGKCHSCLEIDSSPDVIEIDAASNNGVDEIRELINNVKLAPSFSKYKIYIIDEVHMLSTSAFNALLLTLEEPPSHIIFILATTDIQNVPITVLSRCQRFDFKPITNEDIIKRLKHLAKSEKISISDDALEEIAFLSEGGLRDAESTLDQLINSDSKKIELDDVINVFGTVSVTIIHNLIEALENNDAVEIVKIMADLSNSGINYKIFTERLIGLLKEIAVRAKITNKYVRLDYEQLKNLIFDLNNCLVNIKMSVNPYMLIELVLLDYVDTNNSELVPKTMINNKISSENDKIEETVEDVADISVEPEIEFDIRENEELGDLVEVRINNCFVDAKKENLQLIRDKWEQFLKHIKKNNKKLLSILIESEIVTASDKYAILSVGAESNVNLINESLDDITALFKELYDINCLFAAVSTDKWLIEKKKYIDNLKNKKAYKFIKEETVKSKKQISEAETVGKDIFGEMLEVK